MRTLILSSVIIIMLSASAAAAQDGGRRYLDPKLVPEEGAAAGAFVPRGWKIETEEGVVAGDLNGDGAADAVVRLVEDMPEMNAEGVYNERSRALVILMAKPGGGYRRAAVAARLLGCTLCHGALGDPAGGNIQIEIKNGVLDVNQLSGSREARDHTLRFRHDPAAGRFKLIGEEVSDYDRAAGGGRSTSTNYLTGLRVVKTTRVLRGGRESTSTKTTRVQRAPRFIEQVDYEKQ